VKNQKTELKKEKREILCGKETRKKIEKPKPLTAPYKFYKLTKKKKKLISCKLK